MRSNRSAPKKATNSYRQAILSLIVLFLAGMLLLFITDTDEAVREAAAP